MPTRDRGLAFLVLSAWAGVAAAAPSAPPPPTAYFNDHAGLVPRARAEQVNEKLRRFAEETSTQILVAVFAKLPEDEVLEDFTSRTAQQWRVGQKKLDNGAVLFVFVEDRKVRIEVGYGLEGALPDALAKRIIEETIVPAFRVGDFPGGLEAGVDAMMAATRGEYRAAPPAKGGPGVLVLVAVLVVVLVVLLVFLSIASAAARRRGPYGRTYSRHGSSPWMTGGGGGGSWGGGLGGGGGFSGGGGRFGGGGASGSW